MIAQANARYDKEAQQKATTPTTGAGGPVLKRMAAPPARRTEDRVGGRCPALPIDEHPSDNTCNESGSGSNQDWHQCLTPAEPLLRVHLGVNDERPNRKNADHGKDSPSDRDPLEFPALGQSHTALVCFARCLCGIDRN